MAAGTVEAVVTGQPRPRRRRRWLAAAMAAAFVGDATSPVVVHYRVLGLTMSQTLSLGQPLLIMLPYTACR